MATKPNTGEVITFPTPRPRLRADVPPFDPTNPAHIRAWENMFDYGRACLEGRDNG